MATKLTDKVLKMPKGSFKDNFLKYNLLKLLACAVIIFGGLYLIWGAYYGYFSKTPLLKESTSFGTLATVESTQAGGYYYYQIVKPYFDADNFISLKNEVNPDEQRLLEKVYKLIDTEDEDETYRLKGDITRDEYDKLFQIQQEHEKLIKNIFPGQKMPDDVLAGDTFPVIYQINYPDHHFIGQPNETYQEMRNFMKEGRENNFLFMFLTPFLPILGFLWLFFSVKHTYKRQQEELKKYNNKKSSDI